MADAGRNRDSRFGLHDGNKQTFVQGGRQRQPAASPNSRSLLTPEPLELAVARQTSDGCGRGAAVNGLALVKS
jgi:hypothetical protein